MTTATKTIQITVPVNEVNIAELISRKMGWIVTHVQEPNLSMAQEDAEAKDFLKSLQLSTSTPVPADENIYDAITETKYL